LDIEAALLEDDGDANTDTDIETPPSSEGYSGGNSGSGGGNDSSLGGFYFPTNSSSLSDSSVEIPGSSMEDFHFPQIELVEYSDNFTTWMQCRKILHNFGYRFSFRLNALLGEWL
jgi:hypothetical protein